jgi:hypothetical protein
MTKQQPDYPYAKANETWTEMLNETGTEGAWHLKQTNAMELVTKQMFQDVKSQHQDYQLGQELAMEQIASC